MTQPPSVPAAPSDLALWRYGIISPLLTRDPAGRGIQEVLEELSGHAYKGEEGESRRYSAETLRKWLTRYRVGGLAALDDQERSDKGSSSVPTSLAEKIRSLREEHPRWTLTIILRQLLQSREWNGNTPSRATLYRFCKSAGLERKPLPPECRSFSFSSFGNLWVADFLHGPRIRVGKDRRKTYLHVILDDASRFVVAAGVFLSEDVEVLIGELKRAIRCYGIPERFYSDNGSAYRSRHLRVVGARLQIQMPHTPPYRPQGRGKVERFFRTVRTRFLDVTPAQTLDELQRRFQEWIAEYHRTLHETLRCSPLQKRAGIPTACRVVPEAIPIDPLFYMERRCKVYNDRTVRFRRQAFEVPESLPGSRITIFYDPSDLSRIWYGDTYQPAFSLHRERNAQRFQRPPARKETHP